MVSNKDKCVGDCVGAADIASNVVHHRVVLMSTKKTHMHVKQAWTQKQNFPRWTFLYYDSN